MTLKARIDFELVAKLIQAADLGPASGPVALRGSLGFAHGSGLNQANLIWADRNSISAATDIDLAGSLVDKLGAAAVFARVKAIAVVCPDTNTGNVVVGGDANGLIGWVGAATHTVTVRPGGWFIWAAPDATGAAVTAGTGDILQLAPSAGTQEYQIVIIGASS